MKKVFITNISLQGKSGLLKTTYQPKDFILEKNVETSFPIIPIICNCVEEGDDVEVIALRPSNNDTADNYEVFLSQVNELGLSDCKITEMTFPEEQSKKTGIKMLIDLLKVIPEESIIYCDITFGTKPMSILIMMAMNIIEKIKEVEVEGIFYGEISRKGFGRTEARLYDLTAYKVLGDLTDSLNQLDTDNMLVVLENLLEL